MSNIDWQSKFDSCYLELCAMKSRFLDMRNERDEAHKHVEVVNGVYRREVDARLADVIKAYDIRLADKDAEIEAKRAMIEELTKKIDELTRKKRRAKKRA